MGIFFARRFFEGKALSVYTCIHSCSTAKKGAIFFIKIYNVFVDMNVVGWSYLICFCCPLPTIEAADFSWCRNRAYFAYFAYFAKHY